MTLTLLILSGLVALLPAWLLLFYGLTLRIRASGRGASSQAANPTGPTQICSVVLSMRPMPSLVLNVNQGFYLNPVTSYLILSSNGWGLHQTQWYKRGASILYRLRPSAQECCTEMYLLSIKHRYRHRCNACRRRMGTLLAGQTAAFGSAKWCGMMHGGLSISLI